MWIGEREEYDKSLGYGGIVIWGRYGGWMEQVWNMTRAVDMMEMLFGKGADDGWKRQM